ncbi:MAG TPA: TetR-like C-terminal domain-containing protein [Candidatus Dormibacteraeota bacterium]|nr:TetR-like C-terminal domain-containing protein [Candidatus Dormibacteraeota bacterium]
MDGSSSGTLQAHPPASLGDRPKRRRGARLELAISRAVLEELATVGFGGLTFEGVAHRAKTGKSALYRRWPTKTDLVIESILENLPNPQEAPGTGSLREDLLSFLGDVAAGLMGPVGIAMRVLFAEAAGDSRLRSAIRERIIEPRRKALTGIIAEACRRGEVREDALIPETAEVGPALLVQRFLETGDSAISRQVVVRIVDKVLLPLLASDRS